MAEFGTGSRGGISRNVTYQGSKGTGIPISYDTNQAVPGADSIQGRRPYSQWSSVTWRDAVGTSSFNSLTAKLDRRYANGLSLQQALCTQSP